MSHFKFTKHIIAGKKTKKTKGKTLNLTDFLGGGPAAPQGDGFAAVTAPKSSWADEMDDYDDSPRFSSGRSETIVLPTAPRAARGLDIDEDRIPNAPPYTAYIANLSYDVDVEEIMEFFGKLKVRQFLAIGAVSRGSCSQFVFFRADHRGAAPERRRSRERPAKGVRVRRLRRPRFTGGGPEDERALSEWAQGQDRPLHSRRQGRRPRWFRRQKRVSTDD